MLDAFGSKGRRLGALGAFALVTACGNSHSTFPPDGGGGAGTGGAGGITGSGGSAGSTGGPTACTSDKVCTPSGQLCDLTRSVCVDCIADGDCGTDAQCRAGVCQSVTRCADSLDCPADQVCDQTGGICVQCVGNNDCAAGSVCVNMTCRSSCASDKDCTSMGQLCDKVDGYCVDCVLDADCGGSGHCETGACVPNACTPQSTACSGNSLLTCDSRGTAYVSQTCPVTCSTAGTAHCATGAGGDGSGGTGGGSGCAGLTANPCSAIPRYTGTQVVDGFGDDFCNVPGFVMTRDSAGYLNPTTAPASATRTEMRIAWSDAGLHAFVHVDDPLVIVESDFYDGDNVQFFVTAEPPAYGAPSADYGDQLYTAPGSTGVQTQLTYSTVPVQVASQIDATGYDIELLWPWTYATTPMVSGKIIGFDLMVGVNDTSASAVRDFEYGIFLGPPRSTSCIQMYCDDTLWCKPTLQ